MVCSSGWLNLRFGVPRLTFSLLKSAFCGVGFRDFNLGLHFYLSPPLGWHSFSWSRHTSSDTVMNLPIPFSHLADLQDIQPRFLGYTIRLRTSLPLLACRSLRWLNIIQDRLEMVIIRGGHLPYWARYCGTTAFRFFYCNTKNTAVLTIVPQYHLPQAIA